MTRRITIDPITRLEGHGQIHICLDETGEVTRAYFQAPDFKGFEKFCEGRAAEEMPTLTQKICGVCPTAHHIAASKALDRVFDTPPPPAASIIRELMHNAFIFEDHLLHCYYLGGPDLLVGPETPRDQRNIFGVMQKLGPAVAKRLIDIRKRVRGLIGLLGGSALYPVTGLPGGVAQPVTEAQRPAIVTTAQDAVAFARFNLALFNENVWRQAEFQQLYTSPNFTQPTYSMGMVDDDKRLTFYDGKLRVVDPDGKEFVLFDPEAYTRHLAERVDAWNYLKPLYLKNVGWRGLTGGSASGIYRVGPLGRLNAAIGMATPLAQQEYDKMMTELAGRPVHNTLAYHRARLVEILYAAERMLELAQDQRLTGEEVRRIPEGVGRRRGVGACEAPRGTLIHDYEIDQDALVTKVNLLVATQHNAAAICLNIEQAARAFIKQGQATDGSLNRVEMAFRAYDPCMACATH